MRTHHVIVRPRARVRRRFSGLAPGRWGLALVEAVLCYLWLVSALNKLFNPRFRPGLAHVLQAQFKDNPNQWWVDLVRGLILPHAPTWAGLVEVAELLVALGYGVAVVLWLSGQFPRERWTRAVNWGVLLTLIGGALLPANYYLMSGESVPGVQPNKAFQEGVSVDGVATLLAVALIAVHALSMRARSSDRGVVTTAKA